MTTPDDGRRAGETPTGTGPAPVAMTVSGTQPGRVVRTVRGDIDPSDLGVTLAHEHLLSDLRCYWRPEDDPGLTLERVTLDTVARVRRSPWAARDNLLLDDLAGAVAELRAFRAAGGGAVIEVTSNGIGRDLVGLRVLAERSGVHIVGGTGWYIGASHPASLAHRDVDELAAEMVAELTTGVAGTDGIRAGVIGEIGAGGWPMAPGERLVLEAAARAQVRTGAAIVAHPAPGRDSVDEVVEVLGTAGARLDRVVISHLDERYRDDLAAFARLAALGPRFGFDTFGREQYFPARRRQHPSDADRIRAIRLLVDAGLGNHIVIAQDICLKQELGAFLGQGYTRIVDETVDRLRHEGIGDDAVRAILVDTPAALFALDAAAA